jgi:hypothetical protein
LRGLTVLHALLDRVLLTSRERFRLRLGVLSLSYALLAHASRVVIGGSRQARPSRRSVRRRGVRSRAWCTTWTCSTPEGVRALHALLGLLRESAARSDDPDAPR